MSYKRIGRCSATLCLSQIVSFFRALLLNTPPLFLTLIYITNMAEKLWSKTIFAHDTSLTQMFSIAITLFLGVIVALAVWGIIKSQMASPVTPKHPIPKLKSRRIREIPNEITKEELRRQLEQCLPSSSLDPGRGEDDLHLTLARSSERFAKSTAPHLGMPPIRAPIYTKICHFQLNNVEI